MADILIRGMEMPDTCFECPFMFARRYCCANLTLDFYEGDYDELKGRVDGCPLIALPEGHGDLIDRNALYEKTAEWEATALHMVEKTMNDEDTAEWKKWSAILTERSAFKFDVADAPTIVPADKEDVEI